MKNLFVISLLVVMFAWPFTANSQSKTDGEAKIQIALLLDTSNSMDGLIEQAKTQLWKIVNEMATAEYEGKTPTLEIALYHYGNDDLPGTEGYIQLVSQFTTDLDKVSEDLFSLKTNGGAEYCGWVIQNAAKQLNWSQSDNDLKFIFIAGNEPFDQGSVDYKKSCGEAIAKGVVVNTIFCGDFQQGVDTKWKHGADLADGKYINIDQDLQTVYYDSPYDDDIIKLNEKLNKTYIGYGAEGRKFSMRQEQQDINAISYSKGNAVQRAVSKSSVNYKNAHWDLVEAVADEEVKIEEMEEEQLPDELKGKDKKEIEKIIEEKSKEREKIQKEIAELNEKREKYVANKKKEDAQNNTLDDAMLGAIKQQAKKKNYKFK